MQRTLRIIRLLMLMPLGLAVVAHVVDPFIDRWFVPITVLFRADIHLLLLVLLPVVFAVAGFLSTHHARPLWRLAVLSPCSLAPLALFRAWTIAPGPLGVSYGSYEFFLHWLTKYPNFGPINIEVMLGIACVVVSSCGPAVFAAVVAAGRRRVVTVLILVVLVVPSYIAVVIHLDRTLLRVAAHNFDNMDFDVAYKFAGPVLRLFAVITLFWMAGANIIRRSDRFPPGTCQRCGYDLRGSPGAKCPECGAESTASSTTTPTFEAVEVVGRQLSD